MNTYLGIEIGGTKLQLVIGDAQAGIIKRRRYNIDRSKGGEGIRHQISEGVRILKSEFTIVSAGIGFGGPVDSRTGQICCSHQIEGWSDYPLGEWASHLLGVKVAVDNDANVAALAEAVCGAGKASNPVFYVTLGSGVGGGMTVNKKIYHGAVPGESEIGHIRLDKSGITVEGRCAGWAVDKRIREAIRQGRKTVLAELTKGKEGGEAVKLGEAHQAKDGFAIELLSEIADDLAFGLSHIVHIAHPEMIVLGGGLSLIGEPLRNRVQEALPQYMMEAFHPGPKVAIAELGEDVVPVGALLLAING